MNILDVCEVANVRLEVAYLPSATPHRWMADLSGVRHSEGNWTTMPKGFGPCPAGAVLALLDEIRGKKLDVGDGADRREFWVPDGTTGLPA